MDKQHGTDGFPLPETTSEKLDVARPSVERWSELRRESQQVRVEVEQDIAAMRRISDAERRARAR